MPAGQAPAYGTADAAALPAGPALITWQDGQPFSPLYGDRYHTLSGARAQAEHVFLGGCNLPRAWLSSGRWTILETGFGLGLNFLSTWASWRANRPDPAPASADDDTRPIRHLRFVSTEAHPVGADDIRQAAADDPVLQPLAAQLAQRWAEISLQAPILHFCFPGTAEVPDGTVELIILLGDTTRVLDAWLQQHGPLHADSVFLDGFDPSKNPAMWQASTLQALARHCRPGTRMATWCVARSVRDALAASGFVCEKRPGLPPKRHCLGACLQG